MDAYQLDLLRRLDDLQDRLERLEQRQRASLLAQQAERRDATAFREAIRAHFARPVAPPPPEPGPAHREGPVARFVAAGGWPAATLLLSLVAPMLAGVLVWAAWATGTPLPALILAILGVSTDAKSSP